MAGKDTELRDGRVVSAPETSFPAHQRHSSNSRAAAGPVPVRLVSPSLDVTAVVSDQATAAHAVISGDKSDEVQVTWEDGTWTLRWPEDAGTTFSGGAGHGTQYGSNNVQVNNFTSRSFTSRSFTGEGADEPKVRLILPSWCSLYAELTSGDVKLPPAADPRSGLRLLDVRSMSGGLDVECVIGSLTFTSMSGHLTATSYTGPAVVSTTSGDIELERAVGSVQASSMSGGIRVHCEDSIMVRAATASGNVRVTAAEGMRPRVTASSASGSVRTP